MKKTNNIDSPERRKAKSWERHFSGKNLFINALFSFIPVAFIIGVIRELGVRGALLNLTYLEWFNIGSRNYKGKN